MRRPRWLTGFAFLSVGAAALALTLSLAAFSAPPKRQAKQAPAFIQRIAMDGPVVAYDVTGAQPGGPACNRLYAWNVVTGRVTRLSGRGTCEADSSSTGAGVSELAVAGSRVAWIVNTGGLSESNDKLFTASLSVPKERKLAATRREGDVDCVLSGRWLGGLVGAGNLLAYNLWTTVAANPGDEGSCEAKTTSASLRRVVRGTTSLLRSGVETLLAADADTGRIAVLSEDGTVALYSSRGALLRTIATVAPKEIALWRDRIVGLTKTGTIQIYSTATGRLVATRPIPRAGGHLVAGNGVAVYALGRTLHAFRIAGGKDAVLATAPKPIVDAAVSNRGVAYAYNVYKRTRKPVGFRDIGNVVVLPMPRVRAALS